MKIFNKIALPQETSHKKRMKKIVRKSFQIFIIFKDEKSLETSLHKKSQGKIIKKIHFSG